MKTTLTLLILLSVFSLNTSAQYVSDPIHLSGHSDPVNRVPFSPDGNTIASGSEDDTIMIVWAESKACSTRAGIDVLVRFQE
ncbi:MAG: WD40 repeat domain-containing protein [Candidatus Poribacteria bacterium]|nr:WD40 repeat domain-containing protein [Candidatus Poribacteria bacterium]